ncbi:MAG: universal stress protein, partial [Myxococcota bacterium]
TGNAMAPFKRILISTDFSDASNRAVELAVKGVATDVGSVIKVVHVIQVETPNPLYAHYHEPDEAEHQAAKDKALKMMKAAVPDIPGDGVRVEYDLPEGDPVVKVLETARHFEADLIVMATEGRTGLRSLITGSVAEAVVRESPCPVLVVK